MPTTLHQMDINVKQNNERTQLAASDPKVPLYGDLGGSGQIEIRMHRRAHEVDGAALIVETSRLMASDLEP